MPYVEQSASEGGSTSRRNGNGLFSGMIKLTLRLTCGFVKLTVPPEIIRRLTTV